MKIKPTKKQRSNPTNHEDQTYKETNIKSMKKKQQTQIESMNHEDQTHKELKIKPIKKKQQTHEDHNKEETTKALGRSNPNNKDQTQTANIKEGRLNPNNEDQTTTVKATELKWRRLHFLLWVFRFVDVPSFSSLGLLKLFLRFHIWSLGLLKFRCLSFRFRKDSSSMWIIFHLNFLKLDLLQ